MITSKLYRLFTWTRSQLILVVVTLSVIVVTLLLYTNWGNLLDVMVKSAPSEPINEKSVDPMTMSTIKVDSSKYLSNSNKTLAVIEFTPSTEPTVRCVLVGIKNDIRHFQMSCFNKTTSSGVVQ